MSSGGQLNELVRRITLAMNPQMSKISALRYLCPKAPLL